MNTNRPGLLAWRLALASSSGLPSDWPGSADDRAPRR